MTPYEIHREKKAAWYQANKTRLNGKAKVWRQENPEAYAAQQAKFRERNPSYAAEFQKSKYISDPNFAAKCCAKTSRRRAALKRAVPLWFDSEKIHVEALYLAVALSPVELHVDHIVPLQNDIVCGLHCYANLQLLSGPENRRKNNRHWPDMPGRV